MIARFFLLWLVIGAAAFVWGWLVTKQDKKVAKFWIKRAAISAAIALAIIGAALTLNNISVV